MHRLREIVKRLETGQVDNTTLVNNLQYAAAVLENVYKVETTYYHSLAHCLCVCIYLSLQHSHLRPSTIYMDEEQ